MSIIEWLWTGVIVAGAVIWLNTHFAKADFHGAGMAHAAAKSMAFSMIVFGAAALAISLAI